MFLNEPHWIVKEGEKRKVHDLAKENREEDFMDIEVTNILNVCDKKKFKIRDTFYTM